MTPEITIVAHAVNSDSETQFCAQEGIFIETDLHKGIIIKRLRRTHNGFKGLAGFGSSLEPLKGYPGDLIADLNHPISRNYADDVSKKLISLGLTGISICGLDFQVVSDVSKLTDSQAIYTLNGPNKIKEFLTNYQNLTPASGFSINHPVVTAELIAQLKQVSGADIFYAWLVDTIEGAKKQIAQGITGIITNEYVMMRQAFAQAA